MKGDRKTPSRGSSRASRSGVLRRLPFLAALLLASSLLFAACGSDSDSTDAGATTPAALSPGDGTIDIATWETYHDDPWIAQAEKDLGLTINVTRMGSVDEMYAKVSANPDQYDLMLVDSGSISRYKDKGLIAPVDTGALENLDYINPDLDYEKTNVIDGETWAIPYNWGVQPLVFDKNQVPEAERTSWNVLWDPKYQGKVMIPDDAYITLPMVALAADVPPFDWTEEDYNTISDKLTELRGQIQTLTKSFNEQEAMMTSGDAVVGYAQAYQYAAEDPKLGISFPDEGVPYWLDNYFFSPNGAQDEDVYKFVDYTLTSDWQCRFSNETFQNGVTSQEEAKKCFDPDVYNGAGGNLVAQLTPELSSKFVLLQAPDDLDQRLELWNQFKTGAG